MNTLRPVFLIGNGIRVNKVLLNAILKYGVPVLTTWQASDLVPEDSPVFCGRPGVLGQRAANIIQQKSNWLMIVGARLDMEQVGHNLDNFAPHAEKTVVDVDAAELAKFPESWSRYLLDLKNPIDERYGSRGLPFVTGNPDWLAWCKDLYGKFRYELDGDENSNKVDHYYFMRKLSEYCEDGEIIMPGSSGMQSCAFYQGFKFKKHQRALVCNTIGAMGMEPGAIGAAIASGKRVIVVTGDGGFAQNIQELELVSKLNLPIHYFVFCNGGYGSIKTMQDGRFGLEVGSTPDSGLYLPDLEGVANAFHICYNEIDENKQMSRIENIISMKFPTITSVKVGLDFKYAVKVASNMVDGVLMPDSMEDMTPKLPKDELERIMNE